MKVVTFYRTTVVKFASMLHVWKLLQQKMRVFRGNQGGSCCEKGHKHCKVNEEEEDSREKI